MIIHPHPFNTPPPNHDYHVLVLTQGGEPDLVGIWGPYPDAVVAGHALEELKKWPIDGEWEIVQLKRFPVTPSINPSMPTTRDSSQTRSGDGRVWYGGTTNA